MALLFSTPVTSQDNESFPQIISLPLKRYLCSCFLSSIVLWHCLVFLSNQICQKLTLVHYFFPIFNWKLWFSCNNWSSYCWVSEEWNEKLRGSKPPLELLWGEGRANTEAGVWKAPCCPLILSQQITLTQHSTVTSFLVQPLVWVLLKMSQVSRPNSSAPVQTACHQQFTNIWAVLTCTSGLQICAWLT